MSTTDAPPVVKPQVLEFFAGIGLARIGLEQAGFQVAWSNDYEPDKQALYQGHFRDGDEHTFVLGDIGAVAGSDLPQDASLAWASSPCTDLSLAGGRAGLAGRESSAFWQFARLLDELGARRPEVVVLENVVGLATSHGGADLTAAVRAFNGLGYSVDVLFLDARRFVPQSRPRLFLVGAQHPPADGAVPCPELRPDWLQRPFEDPTLVTHQAGLPPLPPLRSTGLTALLEDVPRSDARWWDAERTQAFLGSLSPVQAARVRDLRGAPGVQRRTAYRRTRHGVAVWEVRADDIAGCLRTARGGSSKQAVVEIAGGGVRVRWMTPREYARLMGAGDYDLSGARTNQALYGFGDAVATPVVAWLATHYLRPLVSRSMRTVAADRSSPRLAPVRS
ncbi:DNA cytosine methyltransferase [Cellulomonas chengniuliangii]|uniref:DNA (cytosine-5-)-methyltransferase n=1 Tax=Cellulomonas chengniuliangii TaxID=2968084 RepID=A0ABY5L1G6_9CELL|nr:DNA cytosine methyltransferase [Cellulomonas chengniuliangii]MCC2307425.1 DNA cytosine methyltransferase [Cellulomonas chengniuliangii]MCC2318034.1 DNA cytosine methyltransferase [Cellulomonas chengniuliangii]UUI75795.1 DNA cytosine methyltransferase [Cellulomonas chengniuliangii]